MMHAEAQGKLFIKYPLLFGGESSVPISEIHRCIECDGGWYDLLDQLCHEIQAYVNSEGIPQVKFSQVKEKFGELRIYYAPTDRFIDQIIARVVTESRSVCEHCGARGALSKTHHGWCKCLCSECLKRANAS